MMLRLLWLIPLLPLTGFLVNGLLGTRHLTRRVVAIVACGAVLLSFALSVGAVLELHNLAPARVDGAGARVVQTLFEWIPIGSGPDGADWTVRWGYTLDPLSAVMLL